MADNTIILQGRFTADGNNQTIQLRSDVDWMEVINYTQMAATNDIGVAYKWQRGMAAGTGIYWYKQNGDNSQFASVLAAGDGFTLLDTSGNPLTAAVGITGSTNATQPVFSTAATAGLVTGSIVRLMMPAATNTQNLGGYDIEIDTVVANTSFRGRYALATAPGVGANGGATYRIVQWDPIYYPRWRYIANISQAAAAVITTTVQHGYTAGQEIRVRVPATAFGMTEINDLQGTITAVTASTITTDIDSSAFTAFAFPANGDYAFSPAIVAPVGEAADAAYANMLDDATRNVSYIGMQLAGGASHPGGDNGDVMYWRAGKSFSVDNS
jgi:hypothetical protein